MVAVRWSGERPRWSSDASDFRWGGGQRCRKASWWLKSAVDCTEIHGGFPRHGTQIIQVRAYLSIESHGNFGIPQFKKPPHGNMGFVWKSVPPVLMLFLYKLLSSSPLFDGHDGSKPFLGTPKLDMVESIAFPHSYSMKAAFVLVKSVIFLGTKFKPWMTMDGRYMGSQEFVASGFVWVSVSLGRRPWLQVTGRLHHRAAGVV